MNKELVVVCIEVMLRCIPITLLKGVVYKENNSGPRTEPCEIPNNSSSNSERDDQFYSFRIGEVVSHFKAMLHTQNQDNYEE